ncbi:MAG: iron ABC transporter permease [Actinomycetaceae bacterium]|nr:iron ABC transporter permease [Actinomycetaceae bacterium]
MTRISPLARIRVFRCGPVSLRWRPRTLLVACTAALIFLALGIISLGVGESFIPLERVVATLAGLGDSRETLVIIRLRLSRIVLGALVGASLAICGAIMQSTTRNSLASPDILGVTHGASAGAVAAIVFGAHSRDGSSTIFGTLGISGAALGGGLLSAAVLALILRHIRGSTLLMILLGVGISATFSGLTSWMLIHADLNEAEQANAWLTGSLSRGSWPEVYAVASTLAVVGVAVIPFLARLPALELGNDMATALGHRPARDSAVLLLATVVLTSVAVAASGPIGFVALACPHVARMLTRAPRPPIVASGMLGAVMVVGSDLCARMAFSPLQLPVGAVTAAIGAPVLIRLLMQGQGGIR